MFFSDPACKHIHVLIFFSSFIFIFHIYCILYSVISPFTLLFHILGKYSQADFDNSADHFQDPIQEKATRLASYYN